MDVRFNSVRRIAVFRALMLGDLLCATPALRTMRAAFPQAEITLIGLPWSHELVRRLAAVDRFAEFPGYPGLPEVTPNLEALPAFFDHMREQRFDLAVQMHGSGNVVNDLVRQFGARQIAGFREPDDSAADPGWFLRWPSRGHEIERMLALTDHLRLPRQGTHIDFPTDAELESWRERDSDLLPQPYICLHAGSQLPSRRWPAERFAAVADALASDGWTIALTGVAAEKTLAQRIRALAQPANRSAMVDLTGMTTLWQLGAVVTDAVLLVANDTGISHIAAATATPSVIVSCGADAARWAPLDAVRHRVLAARTPCRPCGYRDCPTAHECATAVGVEQVMSEIGSMLQRKGHRCVAA